MAFDDREQGENGDSEQLDRDELLRLQSASLTRLMAAHGTDLNADLLAAVEAEWPSDG